VQELRRSFLFVPILAANLALAQSYHVRSITSEDGLISNQVNSVVQDNDGQLWISTAKGVTGYDGLHWFELPDSMPVPISTDTRLMKLPDGRILAAGHAKNDQFKVQIYTNNSFEEIEVPGSDLKFRKLLEVTHSAGHLFLHLLFNDTLRSYSVEEDRWRTLAIPESLVAQVNRLRAFKDELFLLAKNGIYKVDGTKFSKITPDHVEGVTMNITDMIKTDSAIYILGRKWLGELKGNKISVLLNHSEQENLAYNHLRINSLGFLFFRMETRFVWYHIRTGDFLRFTADNDDVVPQNSSLYIDKENNLWVTSYRGLHRFNSFHFLGSGMVQLAALPFQSATFIRLRTTL
jgi:ligand-binding sensor domain-containing protein